MTSAYFVPPSICGTFRSVKAQRLVGKKLVDHAVDSKAHCNTATWSLKSCITWGAGTATYPSTIPIVTNHISKCSKFQAFKGIAYPMAQARVESFSMCGDAVRLYVLAGTNSQYSSCGNLIESPPQGRGILPISVRYRIPLCSSLCEISVIGSR